jgi:hypothetical protein
MWKVWVASEKPFLSRVTVENEFYLIDQGVSILTGRTWKVYGYKEGRGPCYRFYENDEEAREVIWEEDE